MAEKTKTDWAAIRAAYELGTASIRRIAKDHGITDTAIRSRAKAEGWVRTAVATANEREQRAEDEAQRVLDGEILSGPGGPSGPLPEKHEDAILNLAGRLLDELHGSTTNIGEIEAAILDETAGDRDGRRRAAMLKAVSLGGRALTLKTITQAVTLVRAQEIAKEEAKGKKERQKEEAQELAQNGRFATPTGPRMVVNNGR